MLKALSISRVSSNAGKKNRERVRSVHYGAHYGVIIFSLHMYNVILCVSVYKGIGFIQ